jgi:hypothetical protein
MSSASAETKIVVIPLFGDAPPSHCELHDGVVVDGECWLHAPLASTSGNELCGYQNGYVGPYYAIGGGASADGCAGGEVFDNSCPLATGTNTLAREQRVAAGLGLILSEDGADCATNYSDEGNGRVIGADLACWANDARWSRTNVGRAIVRCTNFE